MSIFDAATDELADRMDSQQAETAPPTATAAEKATLQSRAKEVQIAGETVPIEEPDTKQSGEGGTWLSGDNRYGRPRGREAIEARQIVQTSAMQAINNGIVDQLLGGELTFESDDASPSQAQQQLQTILRDVITGPHLNDEDLDDLVTAAVEDMLGPGDAYWQLLGPAEDSSVSLPVVSLSSLDTLTIRRNVNRHGMPLDPPYYQAPNAFSPDGITAIDDVDAVALQQSDLVVFRYPKGNRSYRFYPKSPSLQVKEWLEILANSTTHHNRFYSDNEIPPGLIQVIGESNVGNVKDKIQAASGDPRDVPVIGGDGGAQWIELGGTAVNLNIIEEQRWFFQMCLASLGLGKQELGFIEDVNRSNGEVEATRIYKRITGPFAKQFEQGFKHIARQFDAYQALEEPFDIRLRFSDPREEHARQERFRQQYQSGTRTYNQVQEAYGNDPEEMDTTIELVDGVEIDYGLHPRPIVESLMIARRMEAINDVDEENAEDAAKEMSAVFKDTEKNNERVGSPSGPTEKGGDD